MAWGDVEGDGDLDLLLTGGDAAAATTAVYANRAATVANAAPAAPTALSATTALNQVTLGWAAASDGQTPAAGLTYNLRVGTRPGAGDVLPPLAASSGRRRVVALGNAEHGTTAVFRALPSGTYYWSVQAVDGAFAGGPFAAERSFSTCGASLAPTSAFFPPAGGSGSFVLTTGPSCAWTAASGAAWITLTSAATGIGGSTVGYPSPRTVGQPAAAP